MIWYQGEVNHPRMMDTIERYIESIKDTLNYPSVICQQLHFHKDMHSIDISSLANLGFPIDNTYFSIWERTLKRYSNTTRMQFLIIVCMSITNLKKQKTWFCFIINTSRGKIGGIKNGIFTNKTTKLQEISNWTHRHNHKCPNRLEHSPSHPAKKLIWHNDNCYYAKKKTRIHEYLFLLEIYSLILLWIL